MLKCVIDIAIGAPYEDNGAVYIHLGGPNGITNKASQKLIAPHIENFAPFTPHMFGYALSKGFDIDRNNFLGNAKNANNNQTLLRILYCNRLSDWGTER